MGRALILVDIQNDFLPSGSLPVPRGDEVIPVANHVQQHFSLILATQDWHPPNHVSFAANHPGKKPGDMIEVAGLPQVLWPNHCVQGTPGANFAQSLDTRRVEQIFHKGVDPAIDSYSGFYDNAHRRSTGLAEYLKARGVNEVHLLGLATEYCVRATALDARELGLRALVIEDGCRGVGLKSGDVDAAIAEMFRAGVRVARSNEIMQMSIARCKPMVEQSQQPK